MVVLAFPKEEISEAGDTLESFGLSRLGSRVSREGASASIDGTISAGHPSLEQTHMEVTLLQV